MRALRPADGRRRPYVREHIVELGIALVAVIATIANYLAPGALESQALDETLGPLVTVWSLAYGIGGAFIIYGLARPHPRVELSGLGFLIGAMSSQAVALVAVYGIDGARGALTLSVLAASFAVRAWDARKALGAGDV